MGPCALLCTHLRQGSLWHCLATMGIADMPFSSGQEHSASFLTHAAARDPFYFRCRGGTTAETTAPPHRRARPTTCTDCPGGLTAAHLRAFLPPQQALSPHAIFHAGRWAGRVQPTGLRATPLLHALPCTGDLLVCRCHRASCSRFPLPLHCSLPGRHFTSVTIALYPHLTSSQTCHFMGLLRLHSV